MGKASSDKIRLLSSLIVFLCLVVFSQKMSLAETMVSSPLASKTRGLVEGWENWWFGAGYFDGKSKMEADAGSDFDLDIKQYYGEMGYRFSPNKEGFIRIGSAEFERTSSSEGFKGDGGKLFVTLGFNYKWYISRIYSIWSSGQATYFKDHKFNSPDGSEQIQLNTNIGWTVAPIAIDYKIPISSLPDLLSVYGGLIATGFQSDVELKDNLTGAIIEEDSIQNKSYIGGFAGLRIFPLKGVNIDLEGQFVDRFSFGVKLAYAFPVDF